MDTLGIHYRANILTVLLIYVIDGAAADEDNRFVFLTDDTTILSDQHSLPLKNGRTYFLSNHLNESKTALSFSLLTNG